MLTKLAKEKCTQGELLTAAVKEFGVNQGPFSPKAFNVATLKGHLTVPFGSRI